jgi:hypothetical protein
MALTISEHVHEVMTQLDKVQQLEGPDRARAVKQLYALFQAIQNDFYIVTPLHPKEDRLIPIVESYRNKLKPADVLDDPADRFMYRWTER